MSDSQTTFIDEIVPPPPRKTQPHTPSAEQSVHNSNITVTEALRSEALRVDIKKQKFEQEMETQRRAAEKRKAEEERKAKLLKEQKYEIGLSDVSDKFTQQTSIIRDRFGNRWVKCQKCGAIKQDVEFASYGGLNSVNLGTCRECSRKQI